MSDNFMTIEQAAASIGELVESIRANGEAAVLVKGGQPVARIVPVSGSQPEGENLIAFLRRWQVEHPDADDKLESDIKVGRKTMQPHDPWE